MHGTNEEQARFILRTIEYGKLPPRETQRRLLALIHAEANRTDNMADQTLTCACIDLLERLQGETAPIASARVEALKQRIAEGYAANTQRRKRRQKAIRIALTSAMALLVAVCAITAPMRWGEGDGMPDDQPHRFAGYESIPKALADSEIPAWDNAVPMDAPLD